MIKVFLVYGSCYTSAASILFIVNLNLICGKNFWMLAQDDVTYTPTEKARNRRLTNTKRRSSSFQISTFDIIARSNLENPFDKVIGNKVSNLNLYKIYS